MAGFITRWTVAGGGAANTITLPLYNSGVFNCNINWGDGTPDSTVTAFNDLDRIHTYILDGTYDVTITGECPAWAFAYAGDRLKIVAVVNWGTVGDFGGFQFFTEGLSGCTNLTSLGIGKLQAKVGLTNLYRSFRYCNFSSIPAGLLDNCVNLGASGIIETFSDCVLLTTIPVDLFKNCILITAAQATFNNCVLLATIPVDTFRYNTLIINFSYCFYSCNKLTVNKNIFYADGEQGTRFLNKSVNFYQCFYRTSFTGIQGTAPDLWNCSFGTGTAIGAECFSGAGNSLASLTNYSVIPTTWGGPYTGLGYWTSRNNIIQGLINEGVLAIYHDYRSGTLKDFSGKGHDGVGASITFTRQAITPTGTAGRVIVTSSAFLEGVQGCILIRFKKSLNSMWLFTKKLGANYQLRLTVDSSQITLKDSGAAPDADINTPTYGELTMGVNFVTGGTPAGYKNGIFLSNFDDTISITPNNGAIEIGNDGSSVGYVGNMIYYFLWVTRPLTAAEHQALYQQLQALS